MRESRRLSVGAEVQSPNPTETLQVLLGANEKSAIIASREIVSGTKLLLLLFQRLMKDIVLSNLNEHPSHV